MRIWPGTPFPLGAVYDGDGTNFSLFSQVAERVELCLFDATGGETRIDMSEVTAYCWHCYLPDIGPGQRYGYRVHGPYDPPAGHRCCPTKLLIDPYAKAIDGQVQWHDSLFLYPPGRGDDSDGPLNIADSEPYVPKSVVINPHFDWKNDRPPGISMHETVIYETHVKGFSIRNPSIPPEIRGTYAALAHPNAIKYFKQLGVTAVELLPVHQFVHSRSLLEKGLRNYWGYSTIGFFAPHNEYSSGGQLGQQVQGFKRMVRTLHQAGIEVILDVVYNHTAEGNHLGPVLSFKGIDNATYYRLQEKDQRYYTDYTGTGNTLNMLMPHVVQMVMDSLRYWVLEMHVDGFRFDLAAALARSLQDVDRLSAFFQIVQQDPIISQVKLIAEPWDVGEGGYQVGRFPPHWCEWNSRFRDSIRDYWRGRDESLSELANRFTGSSDLYADTGRRPYASINFVTAHDGFTLADLVSYEHKHNEANGEDGRDGFDDNRSCNCGVEGPTDDPHVNELRARLRRNFMTTLLLAQGIPMILGGDEIGRTKHGNNNTYCQDNETSWYDWQNADKEFFRFTSFLIHLRREHPTFRRWRWLGVSGGPISQVGWYRPDGSEMADADWQTGYAKTLQILLNGKNVGGLDPNGRNIVDDDFLLMFNSHDQPVRFRIVCWDKCGGLERIIDTAVPFVEQPTSHDCGQDIELAGRSIVVLRCQTARDEFHLPSGLL